MIRRGVVALALVAACSSGDPAPGPATASAPPPPPPPRDAAVDGRTAIGSTAPGALDPDPAPPIARPPRAKRRPPRPIDIMLKSTPPHAIAAVDGVQVGRTPTYWSGDADGREHEFTFVLDGHAVGRYRFIPIQSGVVHARLFPVVGDQRGAGVDAGLAPVPAPAPTPIGVVPEPTPPPPATVVEPPPGPVAPSVPSSPVGPTP